MNRKSSIIYLMINLKKFLKNSLQTASNQRYQFDADSTFYLYNWYLCFFFRLHIYQIESKP